MKYLVLALIKLYQLCLAPFIGNVCRFAPSCSNYAYQALQTHGFFKGGWLTLKRIAKCAAWHPGGHDEVPK